MPKYSNWQRDPPQNRDSEGSNPSLGTRQLFELSGPNEASVSRSPLRSSLRSSNPSLGTTFRRTPTMVVNLSGKQAESSKDSGSIPSFSALITLEGTVHGAQPALNTGGWAHPGRSIRLPSATEGDSSVELGPASKTGGPHGQQFDPASFRQHQPRSNQS